MVGMKIVTLYILIVAIIYPIDNGNGQWVPVNYPGSGNIQRCISVIDSNVFIGTDQGAFRSIDGGSSWISIDSGMTNTDVFCLAASGTNLIAGTNGGGIFLSTNRGMTWTPINTGLSDLNIYTIAVKDSDVYAASFGPLFRSSDYGSNWTELESSHSIFVLAISDTNLFAGTLGAGILLSTDRGDSWSMANQGFPIHLNISFFDTTWTYSDVNCFTINGTKLFAGTSGDGIFLSTNNGASWDAVNNGLTNNWVKSLLLNDKNLFAGTGGGVFYSNDNGVSWLAVNDGLIETPLSETSINLLAVCGTNLFAAGWNYLWRRPLSEMITGIESNHGSAPIHFALEQNYPNPFNPSTSISFDLHEQSLVVLQIYDLLGRTVATLVNNELMPPGKYTKRWNASRFAGGIYFYRLQANSFTETKKLFLLK